MQEYPAALAVFDRKQVAFANGVGLGVASTPKSFTRPLREATEPDVLASEVRHVGALADAVVDRLLARLGEAITTRSTLVVGRQSDATLSDDTLVDQTCSRVPRELYLRLARRGAFRSFKEGKRWFAFWGEVRAALDARMASRPSPTKTAGEEDDALDSLRKQVGLKSKGAA